MAENNAAEFSRMKQEAVRRMQEMQHRAQEIFGTAPQEQKNSPPPQPSAGQGAVHGELFRLAGIPIDEEKALIGMLIYILYKQGADIKLLLALGYLLI